MQKCNKVRNNLIFLTKPKLKNQKDCKDEDFELTPESILFICIQDSDMDLLEKLKEIRFSVANSRNLMLYPIHHAKSNMNHIN